MGIQFILKQHIAVKWKITPLCLHPKCI